MVDRFVRLPTELLEALLRVRLNGAQWRILLWVIRQTLGWNRDSTPFSWYRIAEDLALDRGGVARTSKPLLHAGILLVEGNRVGLQRDPTRWKCSGPAHNEGRAMTLVSVDARHRTAMTAIIASADIRQRNRCLASALFRRAKDRCKDRLKTYKDMRSHSGRATQGAGDPPRRHLAGAAQPVPGKYDGVSEN